MTARLRSDIFVDLIRRRCELHGGFASIRRKGDASAGTVWLVLFARNGKLSLYCEDSHQANHPWRCVLTDTDEGTIRVKLDKEADFDGDFWVVDLEMVDPAFLTDLTRCGSGSPSGN